MACSTGVKMFTPEAGCLGRIWKDDGEHLKISFNINANPNTAFENRLVAEFYDSGTHSMSANSFRYICNAEDL